MNLVTVSVVEILSKPYQSESGRYWFVDCTVDCWGGKSFKQKSFMSEVKANALEVGDSWDE